MKKILDMHDKGVHIICMKDDNKINPYRIYNCYYDKGEHRKLIDKYADFESVLHRALQFYSENKDLKIIW